MRMGKFTSIMQNLTPIWKQLIFIASHLQRLILSVNIKKISNEVEPVTPDVGVRLAGKLSYVEPVDVGLMLGGKSTYGKLILIFMYWFIHYGINNIFLWWSPFLFWILGKWKGQQNILFSVMQQIWGSNTTRGKFYSNERGKYHAENECTSSNESRKKTLELLSALSETLNVASNASKEKKKNTLLFERDVSLLILIFDFLFCNYS